ncbi:MAG: metallophosphoesterase [Clostridia bacterium]
MKNNPSAILCSDIHLREREANPVCRLDSYWDAQWKKLDFISELQQEYDCPVLCGGDLFDKWKPSPELLSKTMEHLPDDFMSIYGQHDLPQHNFELRHKSGIFTLEMARDLNTLGYFENHKNVKFQVYGCNWKESPPTEVDSRVKNILVWHIGTYQGKEPYPGCSDPKAGTLLRKYPQYDLILTGDNHKPFVEEFEGRLLVNPGSMMRMDADQIDHKPRVYLWYAETNTVEPVYLPIEKNVISREHLTIQTEKENRMEAFISQIDTNWEITLNFEDNLVEYEKVNKTRKPIMDIIFKALEV